MPVYEYLCPKCQVIYNFHSNIVDTKTVPACPKCDCNALVRQVSVFSTLNSQDELSEDIVLKSFSNLLDNIDEIKDDNSGDLVSSLQKFSKGCSTELGEKVDVAIERIKQGEPPEQVEKDMGELLMNESFSLENVKLQVAKEGKKMQYDETFYDLRP